MAATPAEHQDIADVKVEQAVQRQRIDDHDKVLKDISSFLEKLLLRVDAIERKVERAGLVILIALFAGSENGAEIAKTVLGA